MKNKLFVPFLLSLMLSLVACNNNTSSSEPLDSSSSQEESSEISSESSEEPSSSSEEPSSSGPTETLVPVFDYQFDAAYAGDPAINAPEEGEGFIITDQGVASTINGAKEPAPAPSWTFTYTGYDKNMPEFEIEAKVRFGASTNDTSVFAIRTCYDGCYDVQFSAKNNANGWQGVQIYQAGGGLIAQHDDTAKGGQITDGSLSIVPNTDYIFKFRSVADTNGNALVTVSVNDVKVIEIAGLSRSTLNANAKHGMGASVGSFITVDYFKGSNVVVA